MRALPEGALRVFASLGSPVSHEPVPFAVAGSDQDGTIEDIYRGAFPENGAQVDVNIHVAYPTHGAPTRVVIKDLDGKVLISASL